MFTKEDTQKVVELIKENRRCAFMGGVFITEEQVPHLSFFEGYNTEGSTEAARVYSNYEVLPSEDFQYPKFTPAIGLPMEVVKYEGLGMEDMALVYSWAAYKSEHGVIRLLDIRDKSDLEMVKNHKSCSGEVMFAIKDAVMLTLYGVLGEESFLRRVVDSIMDDEFRMILMSAWIQHLDTIASHREASLAKLN